MFNRRQKDGAHNLLGIEREEVPECSDLQARIIEQSKAVEQVVSATVTTHRPKLMSLVWRFIMPLSATAILVLSAYLVLPTMMEDNFQPQFSAEPLTIAEIEFQEALLMQDELMFAQL